MCIITVRRMISGELLKYQIELRIGERYGWRMPGSSRISLTKPMKVIGNAERQETGSWLNNRAENSHQPFRRRERAMAKFRDVNTLQKFAAVHASI